jgi:glycosyltransferase
LSEKDDGIYDAMNKGLVRAQGDIVGFLNSDDAFHDESVLASISDALVDADVVYGDISMITDHVSKKQIRIWKGGRFSRVAFHLGWMPPHPTFYVRKEVLEKAGKFDTRYRIAGDYDLTLRVLMLHAFRIRYLSKTLVDYQLGGASSNSLCSIIKSNLESLDSRRRHLGHMAIDLAFFLKPASKVLQIQWPHRREVRQAPRR